MLSRLPTSVTRPTVPRPHRLLQATLRRSALAAVCVRKGGRELTDPAALASYAGRSKPQHLLLLCRHARGVDAWLQEGGAQRMLQTPLQGHILQGQAPLL